MYTSKQTILYIAGLEGPLERERRGNGKLVPVHLGTSSGRSNHQRNLQNRAHVLDIFFTQLTTYENGWLFMMCEENQHSPAFCTTLLSPPDRDGNGLAVKLLSLFSFLVNLYGISRRDLLQFFTAQPTKCELHRKPTSQLIEIASEIRADFLVT